MTFRAFYNLRCSLFFVSCLLVLPETSQGEISNNDFFSMDTLVLLGQCDVDIVDVVEIMGKSLPDLAAGGDDHKDRGGSTAKGGAEPAPLSGGDDYYDEEEEYEGDWEQEQPQGDPIVAQFMHYLQNVRTTCTDEQEGLFHYAMETFESCSGIDLFATVETSMNVLFGSAIQCLLATAREDDSTGGNDEDEGRIIVLSEQCANVLLGDNTVGNALRSTILFPDRVLPCYSRLSESIPGCVLDYWPMPITGSLLKVATCLVGGSDQLLEMFYKKELAALDTCLPTVDQTKSCKAIARRCGRKSSTLLKLPPPLLGMPFPDGMIRMAMNNHIGHVVERYQNATLQCVNRIWDGWTSLPEPPLSGDKTMDEAELSNTLTKGQMAMSNDESYMQSTVGPFLVGLLSGVAFSGLIFLVSKRMCCHRDLEQPYQPVFPDDKDLTES